MGNTSTTTSNYLFSFISFFSLYLFGVLHSLGNIRSKPSKKMTNENSATPSLPHLYSSPKNFYIQNRL